MSSPSSDTSSRPVRILMIHGLWETGPIFHTKTVAIESALQDALPHGVELVYTTGHIKLNEAPYDPDGQLDAKTKAEPLSYTWFKTNEQNTPFTYDGLDGGLEVIANDLREKGPFDGVMGFSQGGFLAGVITSLLESGRREAMDAYAKEHDAYGYPESFRGLSHPPLRFAVNFSGFAPLDNYLYGGFYEPKITTPMLHFVGSEDKAVVPARTMALVRNTVEAEGESDKRMVRYPGGHVIPMEKQYINRVTDFVKEVCA